MSKGKATPRQLDSSLLMQTQPTDLDSDAAAKAASNPPRRRSRGWLFAAAAAGAIAGGLFVSASFIPLVAPYLAAAAIFLGVAIGAMLMRRARDQELLVALSPDEEVSADRHWQLSEIAEHYRQNADNRRRAEAASSAKSQFLTTVSHELRTPLSGILGLTNVLLETSLTAEQETFAKAVRTSGELMLGLIDDMLDFAKIEVGRFDLSPTPIDLEPYLEEVAELFFSRGEAKGLDLATYVDPATPHQFTVDAPRLRQVLINLIGNAMKFTQTGGVAVNIVPDPSDSQRLRFAVEDTGPGIPPELAGRIFNEFERAAADPDRRFAGSGLGLAIAQRIIERMNSEIQLNDRPGGGSVFSFALTMPQNERGASEPSAELSGKRGLILAPAGLAPAVIVKQLEECGATARASDNLSQAAALAGAAAAASEDYDFVLLDQRVVDDPPAALKTIREAAGRPMPAAILIQPGRRRTTEEMRAGGFGAYLVRPIRRCSLIRIAEQLITDDNIFGADPRDQRPSNTPQFALGSRLRVLIAEDDEINALLLRSMLQRQGHETTEVADGAAAVERASAGDFDVMLLDLSLPLMDGLEAAKAIRRAEQENGNAAATLIAVTADARPEARETALAAGFDRFVQKPLTPAMLRELLSTSKATTAAA